MSNLSSCRCRSAAAATRACGTSREPYSLDTERLPPAVTVSQSNPLPGVQWEGSQEMRANHSSPSSAGERPEDKRCQPSARNTKLLVSTEAFDINVSPLTQRGGQEVLTSPPRQLEGTTRIFKTDGKKHGLSIDFGFMTSCLIRMVFIVESCFQCFSSDL